MIGQGWTPVLWVLVNRRILVDHFSEILNSLAADSEAIQARKPLMRQYATFSSQYFAGGEVPASFLLLLSIAHGKLVARRRQT